MENKTKKNSWTQAKKNRAIWVGLAALVFGIMIFFIWLIFGKIKESSKDISSAKSALALSKIQVEEIEDFKSKYGTYVSNLQRIDRAILDPQNPLGFIEFLENLASEENVNLIISPLSPSKEPEFKTLSAQLALEGKFINTLNFINKMENGAYLVSAQNLTVEHTGVSKTGTESSEKMSRANIAIRVLTR